MRKINKVIMILMSCCMFLVGCNKGAEPSEIAQTLYKFYVQEDLTNIEELGLKQEEATKIIDSGIESFETELEDSLKSMGGEYQVDIKKDDIKKAITARRALEKKLTSEVESISEEKNKAEIKLYTTYFDEAEIYETASKALEVQMQDTSIETEELFVQECIDIYIQEIVKAYETAEIIQDKRSILAEFTKEDGIWLPTEQQAFIDHLTELTSGYEAE